mgnify:CR=1 FL=1
MQMERQLSIFGHKNLFDGVATSAFNRDTSFQFDSGLYRPSLFAQRGDLDIFENVQKAQLAFLSDDYDDHLFSNPNSRCKDYDPVSSDDQTMRPVLDEILNF